MSDFLDHMASRSQGQAPLLHPRLLSMYEGGPDLFEEIHAEREVSPAPRPGAPPRPARRPAASPDEAPPAQAWLDPEDPEPWPEAETVRASRPSAPSPARPGAAEIAAGLAPPAPVEAAAAAPRVAPSPGPAPAAAGSPPAAIVRRRAVEATGAASQPWGRSEPPVPAPAAAGREPDPGLPASRPPRLAELVWPDEGHSDDPHAGSPPTAFPTVAEAAAIPGARKPVADPAAAPPPARPGDSPLPAIPPRRGAAAEALDAVAPSAPPASFGAPPFAARAEAAPAPAPVEIRIGRIDIHAAPPAAPAAPVAAPGPSLDAFLARPRR